jgi:predicted house-cleaning noncanonical NTP pyrophosphatase (MazG superfamily)
MLAREVGETWWNWRWDRNREYMVETVRLAKRCLGGGPEFLSGQLQREGADPSGRGEEKLVRDHVPGLLKRQGVGFRLRTATEIEAGRWLARKLVEETTEVAEAAVESRPDIAEEIADVLETIDALREWAGIGPDELDRVRREKRATLGGFNGRLIMEKVFDHRELPEME